MSAIHVCALSRIGPQVEATGARALVTLMKADAGVKRPAAIAPAQHLRLSVSDIVEAAPGLVAPQADHVACLLAFARQWDRRAPMLIHCYAGVSRSTAAAFIAACALMPARAEREIADEIRRRSPTASPNALLVKFADELLQRKGQMIAAIEAIGRGEDCFEGVPFGLEIA